MRRTRESTLAISPDVRWTPSGVDATAAEPSFLEVIGFTRQDLMWSLALWLMTLGFAPLVIFYVLMVN